MPSGAAQDNEMVEKVICLPLGGNGLSGKSCVGRGAW